MTRTNWLARRKLLAIAAALALATAGIGGLWQGRTTADDTNNPAAERDADRGAPAEAKHEANNLSLAFRKAAEEAIPTVVTIETVSKARVLEGRGQRKGENPFQGENPFEGTPFEDFFSNNGRGFQMPARQGTGSGVIVDKSGIVLTNNHVVEGADEVTVRLSDGREFKASDIKTDPATDLAVLRIKADGSLPAARLGDSDKLQIGDWVIAVGNPFHLDSTVSAGIISSKGRELNPSKRSRYLQTDAAINPGNSGGPLVDLEGEVVGINTAIATNSGGYQGIGFAIPSNQAKWVMNQLIKSGVVRRGYLGVQIQEVKGDLAEGFGVGRHAGVAVASVMRGSPAAEAGFEEGDVILEYAGTKVRTPRDLQELVERAPLNSKQQVRVLRAGQPVDLQVVIKPMPEELGKLAGVEGGHSEGRSRRPGFKADEFGLEVTDLTDSVAERLGLEGQKGVLVTEVAPDSPASQAGMREGTLILRVGTKAGGKTESVESVEQFERLMKDASLEHGVLMLCRTDGQNHFVILKKE
jgi:serine protease Do